MINKLRKKPKIKMDYYVKQIEVYRNIKENEELEAPGMLSKKKVAILIPNHKKEFSDAEKISIKHLMHFLGYYDKYFIVPEGLKINYPGIAEEYFNKKYFKNHKANSNLLLREEFYQRFKDYEYILIYQLDCLIFSDQLLHWCDQGYDYVGAPWYKDAMKEYIKGAEDYDVPDMVGNGGFSLRNVENSLKVLKKAKKTLFSIIKDLFFSEISLIKNKETRIKGYLKAVKMAYVNSAAYRRSYKGRGEYNEDWFWSFEAKNYYPEFKIPSPDIAVGFAFEVGPRYCFEKNNRKLPFGCHAWEKYDKEFWLPYLVN